MSARAGAALTALTAFLALAAALSACSSPQPAAIPSAPAGPDALFTPAAVTSGVLEYAPDHSTFAPVLTERVAYPTQEQANAAYLRSMATAPSSELPPASIRLFGCQPGALDAETARVTRDHGVLCAVDYLDAGGRSLRREATNFVYAHGVWNLQPVYPPRSLVPWRNREGSPKDFWWWVPGRPRYE